MGPSWTDCTSRKAAAFIKEAVGRKAAEAFLGEIAGGHADP